MTVMRSPLTTVALGVCCATLGWLVYSEVTTPIQIPPLAEPAAIDPGPVQQKRLPNLPPISAFKEIVARPLFVKGRRPAKVVRPVKVTKPHKINIMLTGIIIGESQKIAHLKEFKNSRVQALQEGDMISDWRVEAILEDRVILKSGQQTESLLLRVAKPAANATKRTVIPPRLSPAPNTSRRTGRDRRKEGGLLR